MYCFMLFFLFIGVTYGTDKCVFCYDNIIPPIGNDFEEANCPMFLVDGSSNRACDNCEEGLHVFHKECINQWINSFAFATPTCPTCRRSVRTAIAVPHPVHQPYLFFNFADKNNKNALGKMELLCMFTPFLTMKQNGEFGTFKQFLNQNYFTMNAARELSFDEFKTMADDVNNYFDINNEYFYGYNKQMILPQNNNDQLIIDSNGRPIGFHNTSIVIKKRMLKSFVLANLVFFVLLVGTVLESGTQNFMQLPSLMANTRFGNGLLIWTPIFLVLLGITMCQRGFRVLSLPFKELFWLLAALVGHIIQITAGFALGITEGYSIATFDHHNIPRDNIGNIQNGMFKPFWMARFTGIIVGVILTALYFVIKFVGKLMLAKKD